MMISCFSEYFMHQQRNHVNTVLLRASIGLPQNTCIEPESSKELLFPPVVILWL